MKNEAFSRLLAYKSAMAQARYMLSKRLITPSEFYEIETKMCEMYGINFGSVYREIDWINTPFRGNMDAPKEVL